MGTNFKIRSLKERDRLGFISNYIDQLHERKDNPSLDLFFQTKKYSYLQANSQFTKILAEIRRKETIVSVAELREPMKIDYRDGPIMDTFKKEIIGVCSVKLQPPSFVQIEAELGMKVKLNHLANVRIMVNPAHRRKGVGKELMGDIIKRAKARFEILRLEVSSINKDAINLFERIGFGQDGIVKNGIRIGINYADNILMSLKLNKK